MATINYTAEHSVKGGYVRVEWPGLVNGDDGQPFDSAGLTLVSYHAFGTFSGGSVRIEASNEISPADFREIVSVGGDEIGNVQTQHVGSVRPKFDGGGSGSLDVALLFLDRR